MSAMVAQHLGTLHPLEQALTIVLAFGPFVVLGIVIAFRRRAERAEERRDEAADRTTG
ncbi:hypothetical protein ACOACQ_03990 [Nocardioides sp. CPCC 206347]|uniref:hypothetical protein n=1 Tax=unclassified Nocardioides TaxID=2615069 RepID=UPI00361E5783